jgi:heme-degrading monooxygenase HmoA
MQDAITAEDRSAKGPAGGHEGPVTLINKFVVPPGRDERYVELWTAASHKFPRQPGYLSLRLHKAVSPDAQYRFVNVARWDSLEHFQAAHATEEFRVTVTADGWDEFPSTPALYEVIVADDAEPAHAS